MSGPSMPPDKAARILAQAERWAKVAAVVAAVGGSAWTGINLLRNSVTDVTTDGELKKALETHNGEKSAHEGTLGAGVRALSSQAMRTSEEIRACRKDAADMGARIVSLQAALEEPNGAIRAAAAAYYTRLYRRLVARGVPPDDAINEALDTPWSGRPRR